MVCADAATLYDLIDEVGDGNAAGEYCLTDIVAIARARGLSATAVTCDEEETLGVNTRSELAAEARFQARARRDAMEADVGMIDPDTVRFALDASIGRDATNEPYVIFGPGVTVEPGARIRAFSHLEGCHVGAGAVVGPFVRLRCGAGLGADARVGNFVKIKNAELGEGAKVKRLSYIGDASIGPSSNVGAGTVTCNYDGFAKHRMEIGKGAFIGSDTMLVAPVRVGDGAMTGSGSGHCHARRAGPFPRDRTRPPGGQGRGGAQAVRCVQIESRENAEGKTNSRQQLDASATARLILFREMIRARPHASPDYGIGGMFGIEPERMRPRTSS